MNCLADEQDRDETKYVWNIWIITNHPFHFILSQSNQPITNFRFFYCQQCLFQPVLISKVEIVCWICFELELFEWMLWFESFPLGFFRCFFENMVNLVIITAVIMNINICRVVFLANYLFIQLCRMLANALNDKVYE